MRAAGGRDDAVFAQVEGHLAVVIGGVPDDHGGEAEAGVRLDGERRDLLSLSNPNAIIQVWHRA